MKKRENDNGTGGTRESNAIIKTFDDDGARQPRESVYTGVIAQQQMIDEGNARM